MSIFKAYDIRGTVPDQLDPNLARKIGYAFGVFLGRGPIAVGRDMRESSPALAEAIIDGITSTGIDVIDIGMCSTPMLNFAVAYERYAGGIMITASHNPGKYNGFKLCREDGIPISGDTGIQRIKAYTESGTFAAAFPLGDVRPHDIRLAYRSYILDLIKKGKDLKIAADMGNGMIGYFEHTLIEELFPGGTFLYLEPDGRFPNHEANPLVDENLRDLKELVLKAGADVGLSFDGDGDRVIFVDEKGKTAMADLVLALLAQNILPNNPGAAILYDLRSSRSVEESIKRAGGTPILSRVGHSFIKETLRREKGILGGELSGHLYFSEMFYLDSGILGALKLLELLSFSDKKFSELLAPLDCYPRTGEINYDVHDPDAMMDRVEQVFSHGKTYRLDGLSFECSTFWFNLRKSNTEPLLRLNLQAIDVVVLNEKLAEIELIIRNGPCIL